MLTTYFSDEFIIGSSAYLQSSLRIEKCVIGELNNEAIYVLIDDRDVFLAESEDEKELKDYVKMLVNKILTRMFKL